MRPIAILVLTATLALTACATRPTTLQDFAPLVRTFSLPVEDLKARAQAGDAQAQYAMSVLTRYGLRGVPQSAEASRLYREGATLVRDTTMVPVFIPGTNGNPGMTIMVAMPVYGLEPPLASAFDACLEALERREPGEACGDASVSGVLLYQFTAASASSTPFP